jgi:hypothetical protein
MPAPSRNDMDGHASVKQQRFVRTPHSSEYEAGGVLQLAYVHLDRLSKMRDLLEEEKRVGNPVA